ncbi:RHTO0S04e09714g1_1 [Rhodotorula toruloides]|uniref:RHTO0S04e09714g1_1 n=2 Tax=Rhodotorula toruloides TaxID=5286 RepID=A0A061AQF5_RHOTO|nr:uncharacterized protein RHTO_05196 [Rhodotorula toruloides NP11]EMS19249.1 hypothetical protein RHTO_05196 [Rhodotorula toruloides NP11]CDR39800.1 RHTO0S04e09714g1_1 [Rhodotorula toruloides]
MRYSCFLANLFPRRATPLMVQAGFLAARCRSLLLAYPRPLLLPSRSYRPAQHLHFTLTHPPQSARDIVLPQDVKRFLNGGKSDT